jgi:hypothetical protein
MWEKTGEVSSQKVYIANDETSVDFSVGFILVYHKYRAVINDSGNKKVAYL